MYDPEVDYLESFRMRLTQLRMQKDVSAREMSLAIGQNENYINRIENGKFLPSLQGFVYICEYLNVSPEDFFNLTNTEPAFYDDFKEKLPRLTEEQRHAIGKLIDTLYSK